MAGLVESLKQEHQQIRVQLTACAEQRGQELVNALRTLKPLLDSHFGAKDRLYASIFSAAQRSGDAGSAQIARIFEDNMRVLSSGVRGFFDQLDALQRDPAQLAQRFRTVAEVIHNRLSTEERAVFPIYQRLIHEEASA